MCSVVPDERQASHGLCVTFDNKSFEVVVSEEEEGVCLKFGSLTFLGGALYTSEMSQPKELRLSSQWRLGQPIMAVNINGKDVTVQVSGSLIECTGKKITTTTTKLSCGKISKCLQSPNWHIIESGYPLS